MQVKENYKTLLKTKEYDFLRENPHLGNNIILLGLGGSRAYGTNIETSDIDIRGIALNSRKDVLLGRDFETVVNTNTDTTIYSVKKIVELLSKCNPNTIELLGLEPEDYIYITSIGQMFLDNKEIFLSKKCIYTFGEYAISQLYRLQQKTTSTMTEEELNEHIVNRFKYMRENFNYTDEELDFYLDSKSKEIMLNFHKDNVPMESVYRVLSEFNNTLRQYRKSSKRNDYAVAHNKIAKHSMHLVRLYIMGADILNGNIITKRKEEHNLLMDIRNGKYLDEHNMPTKEFFDIVEDYKRKFEVAAKNTKLPETPDYNKIENFLCNINHYIVTK